MTDTLASLLALEAEPEAPPRQVVTPKRERPRCGARTRAGGRCQAPAVWNDRANAPRNGRCRLHGGCSVGPVSLEGKARVAAAARRTLLARWAATRSP
jgi:hypothetical protein